MRCVVKKDPSRSLQQNRPRKLGWAKQTVESEYVDLGRVQKHSPRAGNNHTHQSMIFGEAEGLRSARWYVVLTLEKHAVVVQEKAPPAHKMNSACLFRICPFALLFFRPHRTCYICRSFRLFIFPVPALHVAAAIWTVCCGTEGR
jgi:hypothetical protein